MNHAEWMEAIFKLANEYGQSDQEGRDLYNAIVRWCNNSGRKPSEVHGHILVDWKRNRGFESGCAMGNTRKRLKWLEYAGKILGLVIANNKKA